MKKVWRAYQRELILLGLLVGLLVGVGVRSPAFISFKTFDAIWHDSALLIVLALTQMLVIMSRGIDLSVAANLALSGMLVGLLAKAVPGIPVIALLTLGALSGLMLGIINAALINFLEIPPIVSSLGMMSVYRGMTYMVSGGQWINANELPVALVDFPNARLLGITGLEWVSLIALVLGWFLVHHSRFGREIRALGGNPNAAKYVGIPATRRLFAFYALSGDGRWFGWCALGGTFCPCQHRHCQWLRASSGCRLCARRGQHRWWHRQRAWNGTWRDLPDNSCTTPCP